MSDTNVSAKSTESRAMSLLKQVQRRLVTVSFACSLYVSLLISVAIAAAGLLVVRLTGMVPPEQQRWEWLAAVPVLALLLAAAFYRRVEQSQAARRVDEHARTNDLFLTLCLLPTSAGEYQPLVTQAAEKSAESIRPVDVVPFQLSRPITRLCSACVLLAVMAWLLPQLDPFGHVEAAQQLEEQQQEVAAIRRANQARRDDLKKAVQVDQERSELIDKQIEGLKSAFREMKPQQQQANSRVLQSQRNALNDQWKMVSSESLRKMLSEQALSQQFGGTRTQKLNEWLKELQQGKTSALQKEMDAAKETMEAMMSATTPEERQKLASQLRRQLQDMKKFSSEKTGSNELTAALDKALKALDAAKQPQDGRSGDPMEQEAMEALRESLALSRDELQELARNAGDMKKLEEALKTLQQAERLNRQGQLDGEQCEGCQSLDDYAEMYRQMMASGMFGEGEGMGDQGFGKGGEAPEDDSDPEGYKDEKSKSQIQAGKVLLSIRTKEYASEKDFDPNELRAYEESVSSIKSGVQAAIESEQVPPGYVDVIKGYFDRLPASPSSAAGDSGSSQ